MKYYNKKSEKKFTVITSSTEASGKYADEVIKEIYAKPSKKALEINKNASDLVHTLRSI